MRRWQRVVVAVAGVGVLAGAGVMTNAPMGWSAGGATGTTSGPVADVSAAAGAGDAVLSMREIVHIQ
jgi:hypothetical protein